MISTKLQPKVKPRIGLFADTYRPTINGISVVLDTYRRQMEAAGWEVYIICPATRSAAPLLKDDAHIITVPSIKGWPYKEYDISFFWPSRLARKLAVLQLDAVLFFSPGQLGMLAALFAKKQNIPMVAQHSTDIIAYIDHYKSGGIPSSIILVAAAPFFMRFSNEDWRSWWRAWRPRGSLTAWAQQATRNGLAIWYRKCDLVVALSRKNEKQLREYPQGRALKMAMIPVGVDGVPPATKQEVIAFRKQWQIAPNDKVLLYAGRISAEKNLDILIGAFERIQAENPHTTLLFVGDFDYRKELEAKARRSSTHDHIIFTGKLPREVLGTVYASADVFMFPSLTDTQGLVLHEAVSAGLPVVMCDPDVTEVVCHAQNGYIVAPSPPKIAQATLKILQNPRLHHQFRMASKALAAEFSESRQTKILLGYLDKLIAHRPADR